MTSATMSVEPRRRGPNWSAVWAVLVRDISVVVRAKGVLLPMLAVPVVLLVVMPGLLGLLAASQDDFDTARVLEWLPNEVSNPILRRPQDEQLVLLVLGYLVAPLFVIVPLMVSAVLSADAFAGEKERKTLESLLHLPIRDHDLFLAKFLAAFLPSVAISWGGWLLFTVVANASAWQVMHRVFLPTRQWMILILWVAPAVAAFGQGVMVRVSARSGTTQEANQLGGTVILPLVILAVGQSSTLLVASPAVAVLAGAVVWTIAIVLYRGGARRFTRERLAPRL